MEVLEEEVEEVEEEVVEVAQAQDSRSYEISRDRGRSHLGGGAHAGQVGVGAHDDANTRRRGRRQALLRLPSCMPPGEQGEVQGRCKGGAREVQGRCDLRACRLRSAASAAAADSATTLRWPIFRLALGGDLPYLRGGDQRQIPWVGRRRAIRAAASLHIARRRRSGVRRRGPGLRSHRAQGPPSPSAGRVAFSSSCTGGAGQWTEAWGMARALATGRSVVESSPAPGWEGG